MRQRRAIQVILVATVFAVVCHNTDARAIDGATAAPTNGLTLDQQAREFEIATEQIRTECVEGRRIILRQNIENTSRRIGRRKWLPQT